MCLSPAKNAKIDSTELGGFERWTDTYFCCLCLFSRVDGGHIVIVSRPCIIYSHLQGDTGDIQPDGREFIGTYPNND